MSVHIKEDQTHLRNEEKKIIQEHQTGQKLSDEPNSYPARYIDQAATNEQLQTWKMASDLAAQAGLDKPAYEKEVASIIENRRKQLELAQFDKFIEKQFDVTDPTQLRLLEEWYPSFLKRKEDYVKERYDLAKRYELTKLRGPRNKDDLIFLYMLSTGAITPPHLLVQGEKSAEQASNSFKRGLLNWNKWTHQRNVIRATPYTLGAFPDSNGKGVDFSYLSSLNDNYKETFGSIPNFMNTMP